MTRAVRIRLFAVVSPLALAVILVCEIPARAANDGVVPDHDRKNPSLTTAAIEEKIGAQVPTDLTFRDENEKPITIGEAMAGKPTILVPVYYRCPMLCTKVLTGVLEVLRQMPPDFSAGDQFTVVTVSMDPMEHSDLAKAKKDAYLNGNPKTGEVGYGRPGGEKGWRFLTGTKENIATLLDTVGFRFEFDKMLKEYNHPSGIIILSPQGKVTRYFHGIGFDGEFELPVKLTDPSIVALRNKNVPDSVLSKLDTLKDRELRQADFEGKLTDLLSPDENDKFREVILNQVSTGGAGVAVKGKVTRPTTTLRLSLIEAADGKVGSSLVDKVRLLCYRYDQLHQGYALNVLWAVRIGGIITLILVGAGVMIAMRREGLLLPVLIRAAMFVLGCGWLAALLASSQLFTGTERITAAVSITLGFAVGMAGLLFALRRAQARGPGPGAPPGAPEQRTGQLAGDTTHALPSGGTA